MPSRRASARPRRSRPRAAAPRLGLSAPPPRRIAK